MPFLRIIEKPWLQRYTFGSGAALASRSAVPSNASKEASSYRVQFIYVGICKVHVIAALTERAPRLYWAHSLTSGTFLCTKGAERRQIDIIPNGLGGPNRKPNI
jgi:hypothetical protein